MTFDEYQEKSAETVVDLRADQAVVRWTLGVVGEAGEIAEHAKKMLRDDGGQMTEERRAKLKKEMGDVLWYLAQLSTALDYSFDDVASLNIEKLQSRKSRGVLHGDGDDR